MDDFNEILHCPNSRGIIKTFAFLISHLQLDNYNVCKFMSCYHPNEEVRFCSIHNKTKSGLFGWLFMYAYAVPMEDELSQIYKLECTHCNLML